MNKIQLGERLEKLVNSDEWVAMQELIANKTQLKMNKMAKGLENQDEYWLLVGQVKGLKAIEVYTKQAIKEKDNLIKKRDE